MDNTTFLSSIWNIRRHPALSLILRVAVSGLLLTYLARLSVFDGMLQAYRRIKPIYLLGYFLLYVLSVSLQSQRWKYLLYTWGIPQKFNILFRRIMTGLFLNNFLPGSLGGDVYRLYTGGRESGKVESVGATIFYERLLSYGSLVTMGLIVLSIRADFNRDWLFWLLLGGAFLCLLFLSTLSSIPVFERVAQGFMNRYSIARKLRLTDWLTSFRFRVPQPRMLLGIIIISFLIQFVDVFSFRLIAAAIQLPVSITDLLLFIPLLYLAILLPLSFNGLGVREMVFVIFASIWGISSTDAVAFSLTVFALNLAGSLAGGIIYWFDRPVPGYETTKSKFSG